jgi:hypothetical protein
MADFSKPVSTDTYTNVLTFLKATTSDLALGLDPATTTPTNVPTNAVRWSSAVNKWQKWNGTAWGDLSTLYAINISGNAATVTNGLYSTSTYADPAWITSLSGSKITTGTVPLANGGTGATTGAQALINLGERTSATGSTSLPAGTTAQRDSTPAAGYIRFNTTLSKFEGYTGAAWSAVGGGATGGGSDAVFVQNGNTITTNYSIPSGQNAMSTGPITINSGVTVTVPSGARWVVL